VGVDIGMLFIDPFNSVISPEENPRDVKSGTAKGFPFVSN
jgi:hypothetical protein